MPLLQPSPPPPAPNALSFPTTRSKPLHLWDLKPSSPAPPATLPPSRTRFHQKQAPTSLKTPPCPHLILDDTIQLMKQCISFHSCQILSPSETGFIDSAHRLSNITLLTLIATLHLQGHSPTCILDENAQPAIRAIGVSHTACKYEFRHNIRNHSWSVF